MKGIKFSLDQIITLIFVALTLIVNILANALPLNGYSTKELSDAIKVFFVPSGYVFSIWGIIYIGLIAFALYQSVPAAIGSKWMKPVYIWFYLASIANIVWIFLWHYKQVVLSVGVILLLLVSLIMIYTKLEIGKIKISGKSWWMVHLPFSIYLGWVSVATIANITAALYVMNWDGIGISGQMWAGIMIFVAAILTVLMLILRKDYAFALVVIWAITGILHNFPQEIEIVNSVMLSVVIISATAIYQISRNLKHRN